jgi:hypothetical protein
MVDAVLFVLVGIALYMAADRLLRLIEMIRARPMPDRQVAFLLIMLGLGLPVFALLRRLGG